MDLSMICLTIPKLGRIESPGFIRLTISASAPLLRKRLGNSLGESVLDAIAGMPDFESRIVPGRGWSLFTRSLTSFLNLASLMRLRSMMIPHLGHLWSSLPSPSPFPVKFSGLLEVLGNVYP